MTEWGDWTGPVTNRFRVGIDPSRSGSTASATYRVECTQSINQEITLNRSGALTGSTSFRMNHGSSGGVTTVGTWTRSISAGQTLTLGASVSGIYNGASPSVSGVQVSRPSDNPVPPSSPWRPTIDALTATSATVSFEFTGSDGGSPITNHQFQFATDSGFNNQHSAPQFTGGRTYTETGLSPVTTYWVRARLMNSAGWGSWSASRSFTTPPLPPLPPTNVSASRSGTTAQVSWSASSSSSRPVTRQQVQRATYDMAGWSSYVARGGTLSGSARSYQDSIGENRRYRYRVRTGNSEGWSAWVYSDFIATTPAPPTNVSAQRVSAGIEVSWTNQAAAPTGFMIVHNDGTGWDYDNPVTVSGSGARSWVDTSPDPAVTHRYSVRTIGHDGLLSVFGTSSNTVQLEAPPAAPTGLAPDGGLYDGDDPLTLAWQYNPVDSSDQSRFQVAYREVGAGTWTSLPEVVSSESRHVLPGGTFANETSYEWRVRTWGSHATASPHSAPATVDTSARPTSAINNPAPDETIDTSSVEVTWGYGQDAHPQAAWRLTLHTSGVLVQEHTGTGETPSRTLSGLENDATYTISVQVQSDAGLWSRAGDDAVTFHTDFLEPQAPNLTVAWDVESGAAVVELSQPPYDPDFPEAAYVQVWRAIDDGPWLLIADEVPPSTAVTDPVPAIGDGRVNHYRAVAVSELPSTADSAVVQLVVTAAMTGGWVYLNGGPGMDTVCRVRANATRSGTRGRARELRQFAGRVRPVAFSGTARSNEWDVAARVAPDYDGASTDDELVALQDEYGDLVCYRDPTGKRWYGAMGSVGDSVRSIMGEVSFSMTEVDHVEGLAVEVRDSSSEGPA